MPDVFTETNRFPVDISPRLWFSLARMVPSRLTMRVLLRVNALASGTCSVMVRGSSLVCSTPITFPFFQTGSATVNTDWFPAFFQSHISDTTPVPCSISPNRLQSRSDAF